MLGGMQDFELRVPRLIDHAAREHGARELVSYWADGRETRTNWSGIARDARKLAQALEKLGVAPGDRVATLAMNHAHHLVAWYGAIGMGGVIHTINPRLFDEQVSKDLEEAAKAGGCGLITVELDRKPGEDTPRVSIKRIQPFEGLANLARFQVVVTISDMAAFAGLASLLAEHRGARGEVRVRAQLADGEVCILLGRDFLLDGELVEHIESLHGVAKVEMKTSETRLALVG